MIAPAARSVAMQAASLAGRWPPNSVELCVVGMSAVSNTSFAPIAMPCSGPAGAGMASSAAARARAPVSSTWSHARTSLSRSAMRRRALSTVEDAVGGAMVGFLSWAGRPG